MDVPSSINNTRLDSALPLATPPTANMLFFKKTKVPHYSISSTCYSLNELEEESNTILSSPNPSLNVVTSNETGSKSLTIHIYYKVPDLMKERRKVTRDLPPISLIIPTSPLQKLK